VGVANTTGVGVSADWPGPLVSPASRPSPDVAGLIPPPHPAAINSTTNMVTEMKTFFMMIVFFSLVLLGLFDPSAPVSPERLGFSNLERVKITKFPRQ
jgi:hypothetical protein